MTEAERIQCAMTDLGLPSEYWAYAILLRLCNDVMHARIREFSAENPIYSVPPIPSYVVPPFVKTTDKPPEIPIGRRMASSTGRTKMWNGEQWIDERTPLTPDAEDLATDKAQTLRAGLNEVAEFLRTLTDDDTSYEKQVRMSRTIVECLKLL